MLDGAGLRALAGRFPINQYTSFDGGYGSVPMRIRRRLLPNGIPAFHPTTTHQTKEVAENGGHPLDYTLLVRAKGVDVASRSYNYYKGRKQTIPLPLQFWSSGIEHFGFGMGKLLFGILFQVLEGVSGKRAVTSYLEYAKRYAVYMRKKDLSEGRCMLKSKDSGKVLKFLLRGVESVLCVNPDVMTFRECSPKIFYFDTQSKQVRWLPPHLHAIFEPIFRRAAEGLNMIYEHDHVKHSINRTRFQRVMYSVKCMLAVACGPRVLSNKLDFGCHHLPSFMRAIGKKCPHATFALFLESCVEGHSLTISSWC